MIAFFLKINYVILIGIHINMKNYLKQVNLTFFILNLLLFSLSFLDEFITEKPIKSNEYYLSFKSRIYLIIRLK